jgi:hypothetical protein
MRCGSRHWHIDAGGTVVVPASDGAPEVVGQYQSASQTKSQGLVLCLDADRRVQLSPQLFDVDESGAQFGQMDKTAQAKPFAGAWPQPTGLASDVPCNRSFSDSVLCSPAALRHQERIRLTSQEGQDRRGCGGRGSSGTASVRRAEPARA